LVNAQQNVTFLSLINNMIKMIPKSPKNVKIQFRDIVKDQLRSCL